MGELLSGGWLTPGIVRIGDTVRRPTKSNAPFVHARSCHLEAAGFPGAALLDVDDLGWEMFMFIEGEVPPNEMTPPVGSTER